LIIETPRAFIDLKEICEKGINLNILDGLILGGDDLAASLGATRTPDSKELLYAR
jgi:citrate lyase beta subunit